MNEYMAGGGDGPEKGRGEDEEGPQGPEWGFRNLNATQDLGRDQSG